MKKVNFTGNFKGLNGTDILDENGKAIEISKFVSNNLISQKTDDPLRTMALAKKIFDEKIVSLEKYDVDYIINIVKKMEFGDVLIAEILIRLN